MNKKLWFTILAMMLTTIAFAQSETDFRVTLTDDNRGAIITGYSGRTAEVNIPATIRGVPVREIANGAFARNLVITSVVIPEGVTRIGDPLAPGEYLGAFYSAPNLRSVTIPEGITVINAETFYKCISLTTVILPSTLRIIGSKAFSECIALVTIDLPASIEVIGPSAFAGCGALVNVNIPDSVGKLRITSHLNPSFRGASRVSVASQSALRLRGYKGRF